MTIPMTQIKNDQDLTKALVAVKRSEFKGAEVRLTKKHAKENGISWEHFEKSAKMLGLKIESNGRGHIAIK